MRLSKNSEPAGFTGSGYRPEIDGLRAIAVVAVVLYHAEIYIPVLGTIPGGFFGVDVFFVISGYLIMRVLLQQQASFREGGLKATLLFWERRARRILPALLVVLFFVSLVALFVLIGSDLALFGSSVISALLFFSNFFFWQETSAYGAFDSALMPLLHTWSLAVEEQFYVLFPIVLWLFARFSWATTFRWLLIFLMFLSFVSAVVLGNQEPDLNFFLSTSRAWEFLFGALIALNELPLERFQIRGKMQSNALAALGLSAVILPMIWVEEVTSHPGWITLFPVIGVGLLLFSVNRGNHVGRLLSWRPVVAIGKVSFSLYLWHFPLFSLATHLKPSELVFFEKIGLMAASVILAFVTYRFVEQPFRNRSLVSRRTFWMSMGAMFAILVTLGGALSAGILESQSPKSAAVVKVLDSAWYGSANSKWESSQDYSIVDTERPNLLVVGNSHGDDFYSLLTFSYAKTSFDLNITSPKRRTHNINYQVGCLHTLLTSSQTVCSGTDFSSHVSEQYEWADIVVLATKWNKTDLEILPSLLLRLASDGKAVVIVSSGPESPSLGGNSRNILQYFVENTNRMPSGSELAVLEKQYFRAVEESRQEDSTSKFLQEIAREGGKRVAYLDQLDLRCDASSKRCFLLDDYGEPTIWDTQHLTLAGAKFFGSALPENIWPEYVSQ